jgi:hypothetical protein
MSDDKKINVINGLLRKAESTTPEEAELLFAKAAELMAKYQIDEAMLRAQQPQARGTVQREKFVTVSIWRYPVAEMKWRVATAMGLKVIKLHSNEWVEVDGKLYKETERHEMFGFQEDLDHFKMIIQSLEIQMLRAELAWWSQHSDAYRSQTKSAQHKARRGFMFGFAGGAAEKYAEVGRKAKAEAEKEHGTSGVELVLRDKSLAIQDAFHEAYPSTRSVADRKSRGDVFANSKGREAGRNADVGTAGVGGSRKSLPS